MGGLGTLLINFYLVNLPLYLVRYCKHDYFDITRNWVYWSMCVHMRVHKAYLS